MCGLRLLLAPRARRGPGLASSGLRPSASPTSPSSRAGDLARRPPPGGDGNAAIVRHTTSDAETRASAECAKMREVALSYATRRGTRPPSPEAGGGGGRRAKGMLPARTPDERQSDTVYRWDRTRSQIVTCDQKEVPPDNRKLDDAGPDCALLGARWYDRSGGHLGKTGSLHTQIASANALSVGIAKAASVRRAVAARARDKPCRPLARGLTGGLPFAPATEADRTLCLILPNVRRARGLNGPNVRAAALRDGNERSYTSAIIRRPLGHPPESNPGSTSHWLPSPVGLDLCGLADNGCRRRRTTHSASSTEKAASRARKKLRRATS